MEGYPSAANLLQDLLGGSGPHKRLRMVVVGLEVRLDGGDQVGDGAEHAAAYRLVGQVVEPTLDQVEPGARRRREVQVEAGICLAGQALTLGWLWVL